MNRFIQRPGGLFELRATPSLSTSASHREASLLVPWSGQGHGAEGKGPLRALHCLFNLPDLAYGRGKLAGNLVPIRLELGRIHVEDRRTGVLDDRVDLGVGGCPESTAI
ncbi:hypothetical protein [Cupriavidus sp. 8B]